MDRTCSMHDGLRNEYTVLVLKPDRKRPNRRSVRKWENNIKMKLNDTGCENMDWIFMAEDRI
jgi:hypothetical protein